MIDRTLPWHLVCWAPDESLALIESFATHAEAADALREHEIVRRKGQPRLMVWSEEEVKSAFGDAP